VQGGNANLNPVRSNNAEVSAEWYFAPKSAVSAGLFYMDLNSIVAQRNVSATYFNTKRCHRVYQVTESYNTRARTRASSGAISNRCSVISAYWPTTPTPMAS
jgi:iron complex outermembrane receptor protein